MREISGKHRSLCRRMWIENKIVQNRFDLNFEIVWVLRLNVSNRHKTNTEKIKPKIDNKLEYTEKQGKIKKIVTLVPAQWQMVSGGNWRCMSTEYTYMESMGDTLCKRFVMKFISLEIIIDWIRAETVWMSRVQYNVVHHQRTVELIRLSVPRSSYGWFLLLLIPHVFAECSSRAGGSKWKTSKISTPHVWSKLNKFIDYFVSLHSRTLYSEHTSFHVTQCLFSRFGMFLFSLSLPPSLYFSISHINCVASLHRVGLFSMWLFTTSAIKLNYSHIL